MLCWRVRRSPCDLTGSPLREAFALRVVRLLRNFFRAIVRVPSLHFVPGFLPKQAGRSPEANFTGA
jgi:hypothetical protein